ncbi:carbamoyltransferase C-terminal domain-containing protein [Tissierella sp.]|uniref:carbamoyltransferase family protein n=1 Tax=Tissierella sp. TaxID=41274 RepID=UPI003038AD04
MSWVLGVNYSHDRSACLIKDGKIVVAIEEERLDRIKHSVGFLSVAEYNQLIKVTPMKAINYCLETACISIDDVDIVVTNSALQDNSSEIAKGEIPIKDKSKIKSISTPSHHMAHAYSTYFASPFNESAILVIDSYGSYNDKYKTSVESESFYIAKGKNIEKINSNLFMYNLKSLSLGIFYNYFARKLKFTTPIGSDEISIFKNAYPEAGKLMGLSAYGEKRGDWEELIKKINGRIQVSYENINNKYELWKMIDGISDSQVDYNEKFYKDIAYKAQEELESAILYLANELYKVTKQKKLCIAGGVGLNAVVNRRILDETPFEDIFILPAANDAGIALGCAYYGYYNILGRENRYAIENSYFGREYSNDEILSSIEKYSNSVNYRSTSLKEVASIISGGKVVGWFQGKSEFGPRALGHRSILADPRIPNMKDYLNEKVKFREAFRPYAPSVLYEHAQEYFDIDCEYPYMVMVAPVKEDKKQIIPAIVHADGTARLQTVTKKTCEQYYNLINEFHKITGVPVLLNTSFNKQEPIIETPEDAIKTFLKTNIDFLVVGNYLIERIGRND